MKSLSPSRLDFLKSLGQVSKDFDPDEARDNHGEWTAGGESGAKEKPGEEKPAEAKPKEEGAKPTLKRNEQEYVDEGTTVVGGRIEHGEIVGGRTVCGFDPRDEDHLQLAVKAGAITKEEAERGAAIAESQADFDKDEPGTWDAAHGFPSVREMPFTLSDGTKTTLHYKQAEIDQENLDNFDKDDPESWDKSEEETKRFVGMQSDLESVSVKDPSTWADAEDDSVRAAGEEWSRRQDAVDYFDHSNLETYPEEDREEAHQMIEASGNAELGSHEEKIADARLEQFGDHVSKKLQKQLDDFEAEQTPRVKEALAGMRGQLADTAKATKAAMKEKVAANKRQAVAADDAMDQEINAIEEKMVDKFDELKAKDNGERDE